MAGAAPVIADILDLTNTNVLAYRDVDGNDASGYKVLFDRKIVVGPGGVASPGDKGIRILRHNVKLMNSRITYDDATATGYKKGHYFLFAYAEHATASEIAFDVNARLYYTDL